MSPCPHCSAVARLERSGKLRWRCAVCGGPVVPTPRDVARSYRELTNLVAAQRARGMAIGWTAAALLLGVAGVTMLGLALPLWLVSHAVAMLFAAIGGMGALLSAWCTRRAIRRNVEARERIDAAWEQVAAEIMGSRGLELTAPELARAMQTDDEHAEFLLSQMSARGRVRVAVRDDGELAYQGSDDVTAGLSDPGKMRSP